MIVSREAMDWASTSQGAPCVFASGVENIIKKEVDVMEFKSQHNHSLFLLTTLIANATVMPPSFPASKVLTHQCLDLIASMSSFIE